ncbi:MAG: hypothetical protein Q3M30_17935 [Candidatus Electrothrix sp. Rat3]|nr:hypothetical protein [Candidatus Electrothrix rattekaaiensis]
MIKQYMKAVREKLAQIIDLLPSKSGRIPELHSGAVETADDFDEPLSDEFWLGEDA